MAGSDVLTGGNGADIFVFSSVTHSPGTNARDTITDFNSAQGDKIDLSQIDANALVADRQPFVFIGSEAFSATATAQLRFEGGILYGSTNANTTPEFSIALTGVSSLQASDFIF
jgi:Ca2+-binding RTX toxin-like protein